MNLLTQYNISALPFWDVKYESLDIEKDKTFIIGKVMNYGGLSDFKATIDYYGKEIIKKEVVKIAYFPKEILNFICFYFDLKKEDFVCYNRRQSMPQHWI
jgi:hypothetical protein